MGMIVRAQSIDVRVLTEEIFYRFAMFLVTSPSFSQSLLFLLWASHLNLGVLHPGGVIQYCVDMV